MKHPLDFIPDRVRRPLFLALLVWTVGLFAVLQALNRPLITDAAPNGIVSFELARTPEKAREVLASWEPQSNPPLGFLLIKPYHVAFGLGLDYLFMPAYAIAIALGVLLAMRRHKGWFASLGAWLGWGSLAAALFDAVENYALFRVLLGEGFRYSAAAAASATIKFGLILPGLAYALVGALLPKSGKQAEK